VSPDHQCGTTELSPSAIVSQVCLHYTQINQAIPLQIVETLEECRGLKDAKEIRENPWCRDSRKLEFEIYSGTNVPTSNDVTSAHDTGKSLKICASEDCKTELENKLGMGVIFECGKPGGKECSDYALESVTPFGGCKTNTARTIISYVCTTAKFANDNTKGALKRQAQSCNEGTFSTFCATFDDENLKDEHIQIYVDENAAKFNTEEKNDLLDYYREFRDKLPGGNLKDEILELMDEFKIKIQGDRLYKKLSEFQTALLQNEEQKRALERRLAAEDEIFFPNEVYYSILLILAMILIKRLFS